ncbi:MAG: ribbon-helix-helix domain-containing protein [Chloroflexota bacterium]|nr:ribbon-helix-helix domain-containing protein [Chloroflexota bacterium]
MIRTQIQLTEVQSRGVRKLAQREGISMAEVMRRAINHWLRTYGDASISEKRQRAVAVVRELDGIFHSGHSDISVNHDAYLAETYGDYEPRTDLP